MLHPVIQQGRRGNVMNEDQSKAVNGPRLFLETFKYGCLPKSSIFQTWKTETTAFCYPKYRIHPIYYLIVRAIK